MKRENIKQAVEIDESLKLIDMIIMLDGNGMLFMSASIFTAGFDDEVDGGVSDLLLDVHGNNFVKEFEAGVKELFFKNLAVLKTELEEKLAGL